jgi:arylsulfatase A-like enzyme
MAVGSFEVRKSRGGKTLMRGLLTLVIAVVCVMARAADPPNIVLIYADDVGYGDLSCYGATRVRTPNLDRLAAAGLRFTDGHSAAATCTPSRYAMLTGEYPWRKPGTGILPGDAAPIIAADRVTLASLLKQAGYATAVVGKWHLGLGQGPEKTDWNGRISPGPMDIGFDECFIVPATGDRVPCVYVENDRVFGAEPNDPIRVSYRQPVDGGPTGRDRPDLLRVHPSHGHDQSIVNGISRIGYMSGGAKARWVDEDMADVLTARAVSFIERRRDHRFFLYFATHAIHVPRTPHQRFVGQSGMGPRGDALVELDACVGAILQALDQYGLADNTLVMFTSDNGPVVDDGYRDDAEELLGDHRPAGPWRGKKSTAFEGGTRVPWIVRWPARIKPGTSAALVSQVDLPATFAALAAVHLPDEAAPDSINTLPALLGESPSGREHLVEAARILAVRQGPWKLIDAPNRTQLYNLDDDPAERRNLASSQPDKTKALVELLNQLKMSGRSRP